MGVPKALGLTVEQWVDERLGGYTKHAVEDRRKAGAELLAEGESIRSTASILGVDEITIRRDLAATNAALDETGDQQINGLEDGSATNVAPIDAVAALAASEEVKKKAKRHEARETVAKSTNVIPMPAGLYSVILADPPWRYDFAVSESRGIENQYPTMDVEKIKALKPELPAAPDCVLFMWATSPKLIEAMAVMKAWGFEYRTCAVWDKGVIGMGYYFRQQHELLLVGVRGNPGTPAPEARHSSVISARRGKHSEKPEKVYDMIEAMYPDCGKYLECFARSERDNWTSWGNQLNDVAIVAP